MPIRTLLLGAVALSTVACIQASPTVALAPPEIAVKPDVEHGFTRYRQALAPWGNWEADRTAGVHWCPTAAALGADARSFVPYASRGHWDVSTAAIGKSPAGVPVWRSDDSATWGEITTHHGFWVRASSGPSGWCWVPGVEATPAHVAWREGGGFVGWAPEPPDMADRVRDEVDYENNLDWVFTLLGALLEAPFDHLLSGGAAEDARSASGPTLGQGGGGVGRGASPSARAVHAARSELVAYASKNPKELAEAVASSGKTSSGGASSSKSSSSSDKESKESKDKESDSKKSGLTMSMGYVPLPYAMGFYNAFLVRPAAAPPVFAERLQASGAGEAGSLGAASSARTGHLGASALDLAMSPAVAAAHAQGHPGTSSATLYVPGASSPTHSGSSHSHSSSHSSSSHSSSSSPSSSGTRK